MTRSACEDSKDLENPISTYESTEGASREVESLKTGCLRQTEELLKEAVDRRVKTLERIDVWSEEETLATGSSRDGKVR